ncbi:MAG: CoA transferase [Actinomycetota bacterium]|nr:CoA transferase [Actinomycetota bacterium]
MSPVSVPAAVLEQACAFGRTLESQTGARVDAEELLGGRAVLLGLSRAGRISAGGATRLMAAQDGWCALTLSRPDDVAAVPALLEVDAVPADPWPAIGTRVRSGAAAVFAERARLLGLPVGVLGETGPQDPVVRRSGDRRRPRPLSDLVVADLSSMWAGPLCGALLARGGATVVKVETRRRPDGTRAGPSPFFDWINGEKLSYRADFAQPDGLRRLLTAADVVIESSRPGALERHGLGPGDIPTRDGRVWVRVTGHGSTAARCGWVGFGDDAAVSGGLVAGTPGSPEFCGDAIADPLTGMHAAGAVLRSMSAGGGEVVEVSLSGVAAGYAGLPRGDERPCTTTPSIPGRAAELGADNARVDDMVDRRLVAAC